MLRYLFLALIVTSGLSRAASANSSIAIHPVKLTVKSTGLEKVTRQIFKTVVITEANQCLNEALQAGQAPFRVAIELDSFGPLSQQEESGLSATPSAGYHRIGSGPAMKKSGQHVDEFEVIISPKISDAHVPLVLTAELRQFFDSGRARRSEELLARFSEVCKQFGECVVNDIAQVRSHELREILTEVIGIQNSVDTNNTPLSNAIYLNTKVFDFHLDVPKPEFRSSRQLAHELMHAWGGLKDEYTDPTTDQDSLMSGNFSCRLSNEHVKQILRYRWNQ